MTASFTPSCDVQALLQKPVCQYTALVWLTVNTDSWLPVLGDLEYCLGEIVFKIYSWWQCDLQLHITCKPYFRHVCQYFVQGYGNCQLHFLSKALKKKKKGFRGEMFFKIRHLNGYCTLCIALAVRDCWFDSSGYFTLSSVNVIYTVKCHLHCQVAMPSTLSSVSFSLSSVGVIHIVKCQCHSHCQVLVSLVLSSGSVMYTIKCQVPGSVSHLNGLPSKYSSTLCWLGALFHS